MAGDAFFETPRVCNGVRAAVGDDDNGFDARLQKRLTDFYSYAVKAKMKGNPEMCNLTRVLTTLATTPAGGKNLNDAYANVPNLDGFVSSLESFAKRSAKAKAVTDSFPTYQAANENMQSVSNA